MDDARLQDGEEAWAAVPPTQNGACSFSIVNHDATITSFKENMAGKIDKRAKAGVQAAVNEEVGELKLLTELKTRLKIFCRKLGAKHPK